MNEIEKYVRKSNAYTLLYGASDIMCAGNKSKAKAKVGSWITLAEWKWSDDKNHNVPVCVKTEYVDGENIKADTWYQLKNGKFVEVQK